MLGCLGWFYCFVFLLGTARDPTTRKREAIQHVSFLHVHFAPELPLYSDLGTAPSSMCVVFVVL